MVGTIDLVPCDLGDYWKTWETRTQGLYGMNLARPDLERRVQAEEPANELRIWVEGYEVTITGTT